MNFGCKVTKKNATKFTQLYNKLVRKENLTKPGAAAPLGCRLATEPTADGTAGAHMQPRGYKRRRGGHLRAGR